MCRPWNILWYAVWSNRLDYLLQLLLCESPCCPNFPSSPASLPVLGCAGADHCQRYNACQDLVSSHFPVVTFSSILNSGSSDASQWFNYKYFIFQHKSAFGPQYKFDAKFTVEFTGSSTQRQHLNPFQKWFAHKNSPALHLNKATAELGCHLQLCAQTVSSRVESVPMSSTVTLILEFLHHIIIYVFSYTKSPLVCPP